MRVLVVAHAFPPEGCGGTERYAEATARGLAARGHAVEVVAGSLEWRPQRAVVRDESGPVAVTRLHRDDLYFDHWDKGPNPWVAAEFGAAMARFRPDVVHLHHWIRLSNDLVRRAAAAGVPTVVHLHDLFTSCPRVFRLRPGPTAAAPAQRCHEPLGRVACTNCVPRFGYESAAQIGGALDDYAAALAAELGAAAVRIAPSPTHATRVAFHAPSDGAITVLPHPRLAGGIVAPAARADSPAGRLRIVCATLLAPLKGAHVLLEAVRRLPAAPAAVAGERGVALDFHGGFATPEYEAQLRELARGLDVRFHGSYVTDEPCRTPADLVAIPTLAQESWSFWLDEAGRMGLPIVASDVGAIGERVRAHAGPSRVRLVAPDDPAALSAVLRELRDDLGARAQLAAGGAPDGVPLDDHLAALEAALAAAVRRGLPALAPLPALADLAAQWEQREAAFRAGLLRAEKGGAAPGAAAEKGER